MTDRRVAILVPMDVEVRPVVAALGVRHTDERRPRGWSGRIGSVEVTVHMIGIGPAHATEVTEHVVSQHAPQRLVVCGIAGGLGDATGIGQLVVPAEVIDADTAERYASHPWGSLVPSGALVTTDGIWGADRLAGHVAAGVAAVDMETSAVAAVAVRHGLRWTAVRGISDLVREGEVDESTLTLTRRDGTTDVGAALRRIARAPWRAPELARMAAGTRRAMAAVTTALTDQLTDASPPGS